MGKKKKRKKKNIINNKSAEVWTEEEYAEYMGFEFIAGYTSAMTDRLTHKSYVVNMNGNSYRMKETKEWLNSLEN